MRDERVEVVGQTLGGGGVAGGVEFVDQCAELFDLADADLFTQAEHDAALADERQTGGPAGIDAALHKDNLDALISPTDSPAWTTDLVNGDHFIFGTSSPAAIAGYPIIDVPMGDAFGLPVGISFYATGFSEAKLIKLASGFEAVTKARKTADVHSHTAAREPHAEAGEESQADVAGTRGFAPHRL